MASTIALKSLTTREAIGDTVYRILRGLDFNDAALFESALVMGDDLYVELRTGETRVMTGFAAVRAQLLGHIGPMATTHMITNMRIDVEDGADTASLSTYVLTQHCPPGQGTELDGPKFLVGGNYDMDVVKDAKDGLWKIRRCILTVLWQQGDQSIMIPRV